MTTIYSKAADIAEGLKARLATITVATGAETDIGLRVFKGRKNIDEEQIPCAVLIEGSDQPTDRPGRMPCASIKQRYTVAAYVNCDPDNPNDAAHMAIRDIKKAMFRDGGALGGRVLKISYAGRDIGPRADGYPAVFVVVHLDVEYVEDLTNP